MEKKHFYRKWLLMAPLGLTLIGAGLCLSIDAGFLKNSGAPWTSWVPYGTAGLVVLNTGLSLFGGAVIHRIKYDMTKACEDG